MGLPLGPLFANIFLSYHEQNWLKNCPAQFKPIYYRRYVDDCFILVKSKDHITPFLDYLNSQHTCINFTCEIEADKTLPFLDIKIQRSNGSFVTSVYRKPTFTGLFTNFESFIPLVFKKGLIYTLMFRYFKLSSSYDIFHAELEKLKTLLKQNGYPRRFLDHCFRIFLNKISHPPVKPLTAPRLLLSLVLPFTGNHGLQIRQQVTKLLSSAYPHLQIRIAFRPVSRLSNFFRFKDRLPLKLRSHVVYKFMCRRCQASYIGETCHLLHTRITDHIGISAYTGKPLSHSKLSSGLSHKVKTDHEISFDDFEILSSGSTQFDVLL